MHSLGEPDTCPGHRAEIRYYNPAGDRKYRCGDAGITQSCKVVEHVTWSLGTRLARLLRLTSDIFPFFLNMFFATRRLSSRS